MASILENFKKDIAFKGDFVRSAKGDLETIEGLNNVAQAIYHRLITTKGTLIHRPNYGVGIKDFQNSISSLAKQRELANRIGEQLPQDPRIVEVRSVSINYRDREPEKVEITIKVKLAGYGDQSLTFLPFSEE